MLFLTLAALLFAPQAIVVHGHVTDAASLAPIVGAQVIVNGTRNSDLTSSSGVYRITLPLSMRGRTVTLSAHHAGYGAVTRRVQLNGDTVVIDFRMQSKVTGKVADEHVEAQAARRDQAASVAAPPPAAGLAGGISHGRMRGERWNTESYNHIAENNFRGARAEPLSTFSIDVDRASYSNIRRFIRQGQLPPKDAVRIEELINYFPYAYHAPRGEHPFSVSTEIAAAPWQSEHRLVRIGLQAARVSLENLPPNNLVFLIDVSGSMHAANKLPLLKQSLRLLVNELRSIDRVAMVVYAGRAGLVLPSTPGSDKERILEALDALEAGGSTAGGAGLRLAYKVAQEHHDPRGNNRVILATDGDFNVGVSSDAEMIRLVEQKREQGTYLTVLGFGMGNLKDSKLEQIADKGNGNYAYIDDLLEARKTLVTELGGTLLTVAKDVKIQVEFNPARVKAYRLIGYENRLLANEDFENDRKDAGEMGAGHAVTALYEVVPVGSRTDVTTSDPSLRYQQPRVNTRSNGNELLFVKVRYKKPNGSRSMLLEQPVHDSHRDAGNELRFAAAVAAYGMLLRDSEHRGSASYDMVLRLARSAVGRDPEGYRQEFIRLVEATRSLRSLSRGEAIER